MDLESDEESLPFSHRGNHCSLIAAMPAMGVSPEMLYNCVHGHCAPWWEPAALEPAAGPGPRPP